MDRIVHVATTLTCALHKAPNIACDNKLSEIQAIQQTIQRWAKLTLSAQMNPHINTNPPTRTRHHSILRPMRRTHEDQSQDVPPRLVIQKPNDSPSPPTVPLTKNDHGPVARRTRSSVPQTVDQPPPRVSQTPDTGPISRHTRSQTSAIASVTTPAQAAQRQYQAQFLQSMEMPVLEKNSAQS